MAAFVKKRINWGSVYRYPLGLCRNDRRCPWGFFRSGRIKAELPLVKARGTSTMLALQVTR